MIIYRLALERIIHYLHLGDLFKENEHRLMLLQRQKKEVYRTQLQMNRTTNLFISILLSIISLLVCLTIPYISLESPCEKLKEYTVMYGIAIEIEKYMPMIDRLIIMLSIMLVFLTIKLLWDGIRTTNINMSPWLERGKYVLPPKMKRYPKRLKSYYPSGKPTT